jgi:hypothetical protein
VILSYASEEKEVIYGVVFDGKVMVVLARLGAKLLLLLVIAHLGLLQEGRV